MDKLFLAIAAFASGLLSAAVAFYVSKQQRISAEQKQRREFSHDTAKFLFEARLAAYPKLYKLMHDVSLEFKKGNRDIELLQKFDLERAAWDGEHGILLSAWSSHRMILMRRKIRKTQVLDEFTSLTKAQCKEITKEFYGVQSCLKTELGVFDLQGHHNPTESKHLASVLKDLKSESEQGEI